jgi:hypothetical protein
MDQDVEDGEMESGGFWDLPTPEPGYNLALAESDLNIGGEPDQTTQDRLRNPDYHSQVIPSLSDEEVEESRAVDFK